MKRRLNFPNAILKMFPISAVALSIGGASQAYDKGNWGGVVFCGIVAVIYFAVAATMPSIWRKP
jgi:hypothetical protein